MDAPLLGGITSWHKIDALFFSEARVCIVTFVPPRVISHFSPRSFKKARILFNFCWMWQRMGKILINGFIFHCLYAAGKVGFSNLWEQKSMVSQNLSTWINLRSLPAHFHFWPTNPFLIYLQLSQVLASHGSLQSYFREIFCHGLGISEFI